jgi:hypothetical protein
LKPTGKAGHSLNFRLAWPSRQHKLLSSRRQLKPYSLGWINERMINMSRVMKMLAIIFMVIYLLGCQGNIEVVNYNSGNSLNGSWMNKYCANNFDSSMIVYNFLPPNKLEIHVYHHINTSLVDSTYILGSYQVPSSNLMYTTLEILIKLDSITFRSIQNDTIIYFFEREELQLFFAGRTYQQISGRFNQLVNSQFYDKAKDSLFSRYFHELYRFSIDTVHFYSVTTNSSEFPQVWAFYKNYAYTNTDRYFFLNPNFQTVWRSYKFYRGDLIIAYDPLILKKQQHNIIQPN